MTAGRLGRYTNPPSHGTDVTDYFTSQVKSWYPDWSGEVVAIIASGPSANKVDLTILRDRIKVIAINTSVELAPWASCLYACDGRWWRLYNGKREFAGLKISQDPEAAALYDDVHLVRVQRDTHEIITRIGYLGGGANSGFQALNLAVQFGAKQILLVGYDMRLDLGTHWHDRHPPPLSNPMQLNVDKWRLALDGAASKLRELGVEVINCSELSTLKNYPKMTLQEAMDRTHAACADS